jgi:sulfate adenylyltransferase
MNDGVCVWLTGLSGAGKSTIAEALVARLRADGERVSLLDGDALRASISRDLGFSKADRETHVLRVAAIARERVDRDGYVVCALISPYRSMRTRAREMIAPYRFVEVFVDTPLEVCERRDPKGLYARARRGEIGQMTGVSDPYEPPMAPHLILETVANDVEANVERLLTLLGARTRV